MKIALVHDYLREYGGAERVVEVLHEIWPEAPLYTSFVDWRALGSHAARFRTWDIRPSWVQHNPLVKKFHSPLRFLAPKIWSSFDLSEYDAVISSSGWYISRGVAISQKSKVISPAGAKDQAGRQKTPVHICYIHHPPRNLYGYATGSDWQKYPLVRIYAAIVNFFLRQYDYEAARSVDHFIANSHETARRVWKFYRRVSKVIYPPINTSQKLKVKSHKSHGQYFLSVGRLTYAKRVDLAIEACNSLKLPLKVVGTGKEAVYLRTLAGPTIEFVGSVSDDKLSDYYTNAKALIFSALDEDFGMVPVEAMAHGTPVIGLGQGGVLETVIEGKTGVLYDTPQPEKLTEAIKRFSRIRTDWDKSCRGFASTFGRERFKKEIRSYVEEKVKITENK